MDKRLFSFTNDIRLCILYTLQHAFGDNPNMLESEFRETVKKFMIHYLNPQPNDNLVFITLHFAEKKPDIERAQKRARKIYARLWRNLQGIGWQKNPMRSISVVEHGIGNILHMHTILNMGQKTQKEFEFALERSYPIWDDKCNVRFEIYDEKDQKTKNYSPVNDYLYIKTIINKDNLLDGLERVVHYITKEFNWRLIIPKLDFGNILPSHILFHEHYRKQHKTILGIRTRKQPV